MRNVFYVLGSVVSVIVTLSLVLLWIYLINPHLGQRITGDVVIGSDSASPGERTVTTSKPNRVSIEDVIQLRPDGTTLVIVYSTMPKAQRFYGRYKVEDTNIVDNRRSAIECEKLASSRNPEDICQYTGGSFNRNSGFANLGEDGYYARNVVLIDSVGRLRTLFAAPVVIFHGEFVIGSSTDYLLLSFMDSSAKGNGQTTDDKQKIAVLNLQTLAFSTIELPGSLLGIKSIIGRGDTFGFLLGTDSNANGRFDAEVDPIQVFDVNLATGEVKPAISDAAMAALQKQFDEAAKQAQ